ncbi:uncharacterized protein I206_106046 [Kwoniella pini CBS 10737]|uniref:LysM domain-containing protein n=1 Tax=Kwoniella pini CBS 10737 TaxID=1296096 RepID=A0A1B9I157_9TREE|nr:uncharacterized protein I206_04869 [Kwoniella pini CBS 10737]OCF49181.1 hypothetical protein I206_04869 [Kwoniella pini CBS 10737]
MMKASTSSFSLASTPPSESEIWGSNIPSNSSSTSNSPQLGKRTLVKRKNDSSSNTPQFASTNSITNLTKDQNDIDNEMLETILPINKHPLSGPTPPTIHTDILGDISRPNLKRLTSETERQVAESSKSGSEYGGGSVRGSFDLLRMTPGGADDESREVEVLIHTVKPNESLAGIALLYGIDLATLRKSNKLWSSDPVHIRTHLYVPLEACRWNKAKETLIRGPGEGQVTLMPKKEKGKGKEVDLTHQNGLIGLGLNEDHHKGSFNSMENLITPSREINLGASMSPSSSLTDLANTFLPSTNQSYNHDHTSPPTSTEPLGQIIENTPRILDVVRIPSSELRFFPKPNKPPDRKSLDQSRGSIEIYRSNGNEGGSRSNRSRSNTANSPLKMSNGVDSFFERKDSIEISRTTNSRSEESMPHNQGPTIINNLSTLPPSISKQTDSINSNITENTKSKSTVVKLRPPSSNLPLSHNRQVSSGIQSKLMDFFTIPPPPPSQQPFPTLSTGSETVGRGKKERSSSSSTQNGLHRKPISTSNTSLSTIKTEQESMELKTRYNDLGLDLGIGGLGLGTNLKLGDLRKGGNLNRKDSLNKGDKQD